MKMVARIAAAALLAATAVSPALAQGGWRLTPDGYGPARIGMDRAAVERALGGRFPDAAGDRNAACVQRVARGHAGMLFMFEDGRLTRISATRKARARTPRGIGVGAAETAVRRAYPRGLTAERHKYDPLPARTFTYWLRPDRGVRFETDRSRRVAAIHAGTRAIEYVEGCS